LSAEDELMRLANDREVEAEVHLSALALDSPGVLGRQIRNDLHLLVDRRRVKHSNEKIIQIETIGGGLTELTCRQLTFASGARLDFQIQLEEDRRGCHLKRFRFHIHLPNERRIKMVRIHLNHQIAHDPLSIPRCHFHVDDSGAHLPFPAMNPRLILHLICEHVEPDFGLRNDTSS
jgi:hypothetical protein